jgi:hypothetical protein
VRHLFHLRMFGLCLAAVFAVAAFSASSALGAKPQWGQCFAKEGGKYTDAGCQTKGKGGSFEWRKGTEVVHKKFKGEGGTSALTTTFILCEPEARREPGTCAEKGKEEVQLGPISVECEHEQAFGEAAGKEKIQNVAVTFTGCKLFGSAPCQNTPTEGEIRVNALKGELGYINKPAKEVGVLLQPAIKKGEFAKFTCASIGLSTTVGMGSKTEGCAYALPKCGGDGIISPITPVNEMSSEFTQLYSINEAEENIPNKFEGKGLEVLEDFTNNPSEPEASSKWSKAGESVTNVNTAEEEIEIKA